jgi:hypothetical protein
MQLEINAGPDCTQEQAEENAKLNREIRQKQYSVTESSSATFFGERGFWQCSHVSRPNRNVRFDLQCQPSNSVPQPSLSLHTGMRLDWYIGELATAYAGASFFRSCAVSGRNLGHVINKVIAVRKRIQLNGSDDKRQLI